MNVVWCGLWTEMNQSLTASSADTHWKSKKLLHNRVNFYMDFSVKHDHWVWKRSNYWVQMDTNAHTQKNTPESIRCVAWLPFKWISQWAHVLVMAHLYSSLLIASHGPPHTPWAGTSHYYFFLTLMPTWLTPVSWVFEYIIGILIAKLAGLRWWFYSKEPLHLTLGRARLQVNCPKALAYNSVTNDTSILSLLKATIVYLWSSENSGWLSGAETCCVCPFPDLKL